MILTIFTIFTSIVYGLHKGPSPFISLFWWIWNKIMSPRDFFLEIFIELISAVYVPNVAYILPISHSHPYIIKIKAICQSFQFGRNLKIWTSPHIKIVYILDCGRFDFRCWHPQKWKKERRVDIVCCKFLELWKFWDCGRLFTYIFIKHFILLSKPNPNST